MNAPLYPREVWRGTPPKRSQLYRVVLVEYEKFAFEMFCGKDALGVDRWKPCDDEADGDGWFNVAQAMALTMSKVTVK